MSPPPSPSPISPLSQLLYLKASPSRSPASPGGPGLLYNLRPLSPWRLLFLDVLPYSHLFTPFLSPALQDPPLSVNVPPSLPQTPLLPTDPSFPSRRTHFCRLPFSLLNLRFFLCLTCLVLCSLRAPPEALAGRPGCSSGLPVYSLRPHAGQSCLVHQRQVRTCPCPCHTQGLLNLPSLLCSLPGSAWRSTCFAALLIPSDSWHS